MLMSTYQMKSRWLFKEIVLIEGEKMWGFISGAGITLGVGKANKRWYCILTLSLIGWTHTQNDPWSGSHELYKWLMFYFVFHIVLTQISGIHQSVVFPDIGPLIARFMGWTWGPSGADRTQVGPMLATWTLLSGLEGVISGYMVKPPWSFQFQDALECC